MDTPREGPELHDPAHPPTTADPLHPPGPSGSSGPWWTPWAGTYRLQPTTTPRARRITTAVLVTAGAFITLRFIQRVVEGGWASGLESLVSPLLMVVVMLLLTWHWSPRSRIDARGVHARDGFLQAHSATWEQVVRVQAPGRYDDHAVAVLHNGARVPLPGLPLDAAEAMAERSLQEPSSRAAQSRGRSTRDHRRSPGTGSPQHPSTPPTDRHDEWEGPFRRGWPDPPR